MRFGRKRQQGVALVEAALAIVVLGVAVPASLHAWAQARIALTESAEAPVASGLALIADQALRDAPWPPCGSALAASACPALAVPARLAGWSVESSSVPLSAQGLAPGDAVSMRIRARSPAGNEWAFETVRGRP